MKTYTFPYSCDEWQDEIDVEISGKEVELIKKAYRDAFTYLGECASLNKLNNRIIKGLDFYEPDADQDIRIYFPEEITEEVDDE